MVSTSDNKRNIMYALGAGAALIGAALIYNMVSNSDDTGSSGKSKIEEPKIDEEELEKKFDA
jgi:hypothetical protein